MDNFLVTHEMDYFEDDLYECISTGNIRSIQEYLNRGLDINHAFRSTDRTERLGKTLVETAVAIGNEKLVQFFIENKANVNLTYIVDVNNYAYTLKLYTKKNRLKLTCLYPCIVKTELGIIQLLVQGGIDVDIYDDRGCTPLWHAVDLDNYEMAKAFTNAKHCDVNISDNAMLKPIHIAAMHANPRIVSLLIRNGSQIDPLQIRGWTPLCLASRAGCFDTTKILLLNGADPNHVGYNGQTPLSMTIEYGDDRRIPEMLLETGANVDTILVKRCKQDKMTNIKLHPDLFYLLKMMSECPRSLKTFCGLQIRKCITKSSSNQNIIQKTEVLPLPKLMQEYLLQAYL